MIFAGVGGDAVSQDFHFPGFRVDRHFAEQRVHGVQLFPHPSSRGAGGGLPLTVAVRYAWMFRLMAAGLGKGNALGRIGLDEYRGIFGVEILRSSAFSRWGGCLQYQLFQAAAASFITQAAAVVPSLPPPTAGRAP